MEAYEGKILKFYRGYEEEFTEILVLAYDYVENANKVKVAGSSELRFENIGKLLRKNPYASILPADPAHPLVLEYSLDDQGNVRAAAVKAVSKIEKDCRFLNGDTEWSSVIQDGDGRPRVKRARREANTSVSTFLDNNLTCPITLTRFVDPVLAFDGYTYEKVAILEWAMATTVPGLGYKSPMTNAYGRLSFVPNHTIKSLISEMKERGL